MTLDLSEIEKRVNAATEGPWLLERPEGEIDGFKTGTIIAAVAPKQCVWADPPGGIAPEANRRFIAHARTDIPALLSRVRELEATMRSAQGYMRNAAIDLDTGTPKRTTKQTLEGGLRMIDAALAKASDHG